ncbi:HEAT repeat domain-containing protein [Streptomyces sp. NA04227]|uniref:HEAT repeat domain-containing protein n=1 Tax=Streptomyces sp. NA04227 TaxID=2742136 RepID=UPI001590046B|nr:HEAT repeat domain-containing protein [Streptomyces sp. NA04227]QKW05432.1 HEAT repeat domain-containing protein [Streptomyces sp. NA04227]
MFEPVIAPSGTLLGLLQRGRGDGTLHALTAPRSEALAALNQCVRHDPRHDWQVENRSLYYARLFVDLDGGLDELERHLFDIEDVLDSEDCRTGLALSVLGHLASYGRPDALNLLRRYAAEGNNWAWALDELALRDDDAALTALAPRILARFPHTPEGEAELATMVRDAFEPRPWRLWAADPRPGIGERVRAAQEQGCFDRWQRQMRPSGPRPDWSVEAVFDWAREGLSRGAVLHVPAARCLAAVAGADDREQIVATARGGDEAARCTALRYLADSQDPRVFPLVEAAVAEGPGPVADAAVDAFERMRSAVALARARQWAPRPDELGAAAGRVLACRGARGDSALVLAALRDAVRREGCDAPTLWPLVDGAGRLGILTAAPVLRHVYRETASSQLRGRAARALAVTDPGFAAAFAVECLWDCEESTREVAARHAETADARVVDQLRRLATDPAEEAEVQTAVRSRIGPDGGAG